MQMTSKFLSGALAFAGLLAFGAVASDGEAPLEISADHWEADRAKEISIFKGNVEIRKGSVRIIADEARIRATQGEVRESTIIGSPVRFEQKPEDAPPISGEAQRIEYDTVNDIVTLTGKAWVRQGEDYFEGESIRYSIDIGKVMATSKESAPERVKIIFTPRKEEPKDKGDQP